MRRLLTALAALFFVSAVIAQRNDYKGYSVLSAELKTQDHLELISRLEDVYMSELDFFTHPSLLRTTDVMVTPQIKATIKKMFKAAGIPFTVKTADMGKLIEETMTSKADRLTTPLSTSITQDYLDLAEIEKYLGDLATEHTDIVTLEQIGTTYEGRDINMVTLSKKDERSGQRPAIIMESLTHAREWITGAVMLNLIQSLVDNAYSQVDSNAYYMMDNFDWYIVPVHNPDGYAYTHSSSRLWRKNRSGTGRCRGVDLNRNWDYAYGLEGTSTSPCSDIYRGQTFFSEKETEAFSKKMMEISNTATVLGFISLHSYSQMILTPMGYSGASAEMHGRSTAVLENVAKKATGALEAVNGVQFMSGRPVELLYGASGGAYDYALGKVGIPYSYTYELRDKGNYGFVLPKEQIMPSFFETLASVRSIAEDIYNDKSVNPY